MNTQEKILVVDDSTTNVLLLQSIMEEQNFEVLTSFSGAEAIKILEKETPELILLDIMMPGMNGFEVLDILAKNHIWSKIPVIMITAKTENENVQKALDMGAVDFIKKPIDMIDLISRVKAVLRLKKREDSVSNLLQFKDEFNTILIDKIKDPLKQIINQLNLLKNQTENTSKTEQSNEYLEAIAAGSSEILLVVEELLKLSVPNKESISLNKSNIQIKSIIEDAFKTNVAMLENRGVNYELNLPEQIFITADKTLFSLAIKKIIDYFLIINKKSLYVEVVDNDGVVCVCFYIDKKAKYTKDILLTLSKEPAKNFIVPDYLQSPFSILTMHNFKYYIDNKTDDTICLFI